VSDGATSHPDHATVEAGDHHDVTLFFLPGQTIRKVQPMDKSVFVPFYNPWDEEVLLFYNHSTDCTLNKHRFGKNFTEAWVKAIQH
jgi:DDE superfamily endonuclease.